MADTFFNVLSGTLSADPGSGGTTLNSAAFAFMPAVTAPDTMRLTLDPEGASGFPEIVVVTAHTAAATSCTVIRGQEVGFGGVAGHAHPIGTVWRHSLTRAALEELPYRKVTTKGDILAATADKAISRVAAGANTTRLVADSGQANGVRWAAETELNLIAAKGDLLVGTANDTLAVKSVGADGAVLQADAASAGGVRWNNGSKWRRVANQSMPGTAATALAWDTEDVDDLATNQVTASVTVSTTGSHGIAGFIDWAATFGSTPVQLSVNGTLTTITTINDTSTFVQRFGTTMYLFSGDVIQIIGTNGTGGAINATGALRLTFLAG